MFAGVATTLLTIRVLGEARAKRTLAKWAILGLTVAGLLLVGEYAARYMFSDVTSTGDNTGYFARQWKKTVRENSWGFREREFKLRKPQDVYRIAVIGDSITFGQGIGEEDRFTNLLQRRLNGRSNTGGYEVLNFGKGGAETVDHLEFLRYPVLYTNPDFILLQWYVNDVEGHDMRQRPRPLRIPFWFGELLAGIVLGS